MGSNAFVAYVCPAIGNVLGICMLLAPFPAVLRARRQQTLGSLNPLPWPFTALNCIGWICYGLVIPDLWIIPANVVGLCAGLWFTLIALPLLDLKWRDRMNGLLVFSAAFFVILGIIGVFWLGKESRRQMWGIECVVVLLLYYGIPLSTMLDVIRSRNSASIYLPLAVAAMANGTMWTLYGLFATHDINLWLPNLIGAALGLVQAVLRILYPAKESVLARNESPEGSEILPGHPGWTSVNGSRVHLLVPPDLKTHSDHSMAADESVVVTTRGATQPATPKTQELQLPPQPVVVLPTSGTHMPTHR